MQPALLITPDGKTIELPTEVYRKVKRLLGVQSKRRGYSKRRMTAAIHDGFGLLATPESLTKALLNERAAERVREDTKLSRHKE